MTAANVSNSVDSDGRLNWFCRSSRVEGAIVDGSTVRVLFISGGRMDIQCGDHEDAQACCTGIRDGVNRHLGLSVTPPPMSENRPGAKP